MSCEDPVKIHANDETQEMEAGGLLEKLENVDNGKEENKVQKPNAVTLTATNKSAKRKIEARTAADSKVVENRSSTLTKPNVSSVPRTLGSTTVPRRSSTGGLNVKQPMPIANRTINVDAASAAAQRSSSFSTETMRKSLPELRRNSVCSVVTKTATKGSMLAAQNSASVSPNSRTLRTTSSPSSSKHDSLRKASTRSSMSSSSSKMSSPSMESTGSSSSIRRPFSRTSSHSIHLPTVSSQARSVDSRDARLIMLPQVEAKANDDVRLDLRGQKIQSLKSGGVNLSENLEFIYLRDNLLSSLEGVEVLNRVKVLDLSFNNFKGPGFEPLENCKALQQLYLAGNQITSLKSLPELPNMEFLSVAQNKLKSLSMACQPRLQVLAASKNKISTLKGFPYLPVLEHLRVEENPILKMPHLEAASILLVGPTLKKFNDRDFSRDEVVLAGRYPPHTPLCIRDGWALCRPEDATDSTLMFLLKHWNEHAPSGCLIKKAYVDHPFEGDACSCHFELSSELPGDSDSDLDLKYQWFAGDRSLSIFLRIDGACGKIYVPKRDDIGRVLKVECTPVQGNVDFSSIYAISLPVSPGTGIPKVLNIDVRGDLVEGSTVKGCVEIAWCGAMPGKGVSSWLRRQLNGSPVVISGAEEEEYQISSEDVDSCLVYMYIPVTTEGTKGEPQFVITGFVEAAPPSVSNVRIIGDAVEGNTLRGFGDYFGGKEGPSTYEWLRDERDTGEFTQVLKGTNEYTLTKDDVANRLAFVYVPVNFEGKEGKSMSAVSQVVKKAPPKVTCVKIIGELKEGSKVTATGIITGGTESSSRVQWFKTNCSTFEGENAAEALTSSKLAKAFRIPLGAVGKYIVAKFTPMNPDGEAGEPVYAISEVAIQMLPPSLNFLSITGDYMEGEVLTASYGYIGGHEGMSIYNWYFFEEENDSGVLIREASGLLQYQIPKVAIGKYIAFACAPVRSDGISGEEKTCFGQERVLPGSPRLLSIQVTGKAVEGTTLIVEKTYWGGEEGESIYNWFRGRSDGTRDVINGAQTSSYVLSIDDIGFFVASSCEPIRIDGARGPVFISEQVGPVVPGPPMCLSLEFHGSMVEGERLNVFSSYSGGVKGDCLCEWFKFKGKERREKIFNGEYFDLSFDEVEYCLEIVYTPVRADGLKGNPKTLQSSPVAPGDPQGLKLVVPDGCEGQEIVPETLYFGGKEGVGKYIWFRSKDKLQGSALLELSNSWENVEICGQTRTYTPSVEDVGSYIALYWIPIRSDGKCGKPLVSICESPVIPALPLVSKVCLKKLSTKTYCGEGCYIGGYQGESLFTWYRVYNDGNTLLIDGANSLIYEASEQDYNCRLLFGYTPVRSDSIAGETQLSEKSEVIFPELPRIETLTLKGKAIEGEVLTVSEVIPSNEDQQLVWDKYIKEVSYQWFFSHETGDDKLFEMYPSQRSSSYRVRFDDIGCILRCECTVTDVFGRSSEPAYAETAEILPGIPKIDKLEIEGRGFHTNLYAVRGIYTGGKEGKSRIQWLRSMLGSPDLISIAGETGRMYEANVDDVGYRLVVVYTPVRDDGTEGGPVSASTDPIAVEPDVLLEVKQKLEAGSAKFEVLCDKDRPPKAVLGMGNLERRILQVNRKRVKVIKPGSFSTREVRGSYSPPFHVELFRNDQHRLRIVVSSENEVDLMVQTRHLRDVIVLVIRGLAQRFNSTSLDTLLKLEMT